MKRWMLECKGPNDEPTAVAVEAADAASARVLGLEGGLTVVRVLAVRDMPAEAPAALPDRLAREAVDRQARVDRGALNYAYYNPEHAEWMKAATHLAERARRTAYRSATSVQHGSRMVTLGIVGLVLALIVAAASALGHDGRGSGAGWVVFAMLLGSICICILILGAIYHAVGRLGLDLAEQADRAGGEHAEDRSQ
jgi:hypothetical protein